MPSSAWFSFKKMIETMKRDFPNNFVEGQNGVDMNEAMLTLDEQGYLMFVFPCTDPEHDKLLIKKVHRHMKDGMWHIVPSHPSIRGTLEVVSQ